MKKLENLEYEYFKSRYESIRVLMDNERLRTEIIYYKPNNAICVLKIYFGRNLLKNYLQLKSIRHENLVVVYDVLVQNGNTYIIEEFIDGETLEERLNREGLFGESEVIHIVRKLCSGLKVLHNQNPPLIHKDIKPGNVMMRTDGSIKLIDFDASRFYQEGEDKDTHLLGTEEYASPEHYGYGQTSSTSDIYSLGVMMNVLLTGETLVKHRPTYQGRLRTVIKQCTHVDSKRRFQNVEALDKELATYRSKWGILIRNRNKAAIAGVVFLMVVGVGWRFTMSRYSMPDLANIYEDDGSPFQVLNHPLIVQKLQNLVGIEYSYVLECLYSIDEHWYDEEEGLYYFSGGMPGLYTIEEAAVSVAQEGSIECAFIKDGICYYYASDQKNYESPSSFMLWWMAGQRSKIVQFHKNQQYAAPNDICGTYISDNRAAYVEIQKAEDGSYYIEGDASWGANSGTIEGELEPDIGTHYSYWEDSAQLSVTTFQDCVVVETVSGSFGGLNVSFDGIYRKQ